MTNEYVFTAVEKAAIAEFDSTIAELNAQKNGAIRMIARQQNLEGTWNLSGDKLVRQGNLTK
jgi:hypothetical protein